MAKKKTRVLLPGGIQGLVHDLQSGKPTNMTAQEPEKPAESLEQQKTDTKNENVAETQQPSDNQQVNPNNGVNGQNAAQQQQQSAQDSEYQQNNSAGQTASEPLATPAENRAQSFNPAPSPEFANGGAPSNGGFAAQNGQQGSLNGYGPANGSQASGNAASYNRGAQGQYGQGRQNGAAQGGQRRQLIPGNHPGRSYSPGRPPKQNTMKEYHIVKDDSQDSWQLFLDMAKQYKDGGGKLATIYIDSSLKNVLDRMKYAGPEKLSTSAILSSIVARFIYDHEEDIRKALYNDQLI